ncbi:GNAT family N-acetyltransferase [Mycobacterium sp. KBS0706]|uniref:GNAT family N-acetyltransferase n=1 Tax=Mycobacterium sp. KBS0706 TaxID=2578109 RepID=UPI00110F88C9|nr:GNAT family N-acetyltransferase [Mycobacterium sp. KBS0706]TSD87101.1 GNAT family N-acetyltransferase [Mycobacterium sp. KBS0706]
MTARRYGPLEKLDATHELDDFDCGQEPLNRFLIRFALANQKADSAQTYCVCRTGERRVVGFYSLTVGAVDRAEAPSRTTKGLPRHPVPVMLLARLAVDISEQGRGLGKALLKDALLRTAQAAEIAGIRAFLVHAKDEAARAFYERFDFEPSPVDPFLLFLLMKDVRAVLQEE